MPKTPSIRKLRLGILLLVLVPIIFLSLYIGGGFQAYRLRATAIFRLTNPTRDAPRLPAIFEQAKASDVARAVPLAEEVVLESAPMPAHYRIVATTIRDTETARESAHALLFSINQLLRPPGFVPENPVEIVQDPRGELLPPAFPARMLSGIIPLALLIAGLWLFVENRPQPPVVDGRYVPPPPPEKKPPAESQPPSQYDY
jgi:hypothetical protein